MIQIQRIQRGNIARKAFQDLVENKNSESPTPVVDPTTEDVVDESSELSSDNNNYAVKRDGDTDEDSDSDEGSDDEGGEISDQLSESDSDDDSDDE